MKKNFNMMHIINYIVKIMIIIIGLILISGIIPITNEDTTLFRIMGGVFILFGVYRLAIYKMKYKEYNFNKEENENE